MLQKNKIVQYDEFGDTFGKSRLSLRWEEIDDVLSHFLKHVPTTGHIADIGCGNGRLLKHIREHEHAEFYRNNFSTYVGIDTSAVLLNQARVQDWSDVFPVAEWKLGDMRNIAEELSLYGLFDGLFFIASFHHIYTREERISVLYNAKKLLSKAGIIAMTNWNLSYRSQLKYSSSKIAEYPDGSADYMIKIGGHERFYHAFSVEEYISLGQETGLTPSFNFGERNSVVYWS